MRPNKVKFITVDDSVEFSTQFPPKKDEHSVNALFDTLRNSIHVQIVPDLSSS